MNYATIRSLDAGDPLVAMGPKVEPRDVGWQASTPDEVRALARRIVEEGRDPAQVAFERGSHRPDGTLQMPSEAWPLHGDAKCQHEERWCRLTGLDCAGLPFPLRAKDHCVGCRIATFRGWRCARPAAGRSGVDGKCGGPEPKAAAALVGRAFARGIADELAASFYACGGYLDPEQKISGPTLEDLKAVKHVGYAVVPRVLPAPITLVGGPRDGMQIERWMYSPHGVVMPGEDGNALYRAAPGTGPDVAEYQFVEMRLPHERLLRGIWRE